MWFRLYAVLLLGAVVAAKRSDQDFAFEDDEPALSPAQTHDLRHPQRYTYNPHNSLCSSLVCKKREVCVLKDSYTALCASKKDILNNGGILVLASSGHVVSGKHAKKNDVDEPKKIIANEINKNSIDDSSYLDDDVFYDGTDDDDEGEESQEDLPKPQIDVSKPKCQVCSSRRSRGSRATVCASDGRQYPSLCALDLRNCRKAPAQPAAPLCTGPCPCARRRPSIPIHQALKHRQHEKEHNEVLPNRSAHRNHLQERANCGRGSGLASRLLDWFAVLMQDSLAPSAAGFPKTCRPEVRWMFEHLDIDGDGQLSPENLYALRHDEHERCLRPFLSRCSTDGSALTRASWCNCLRRALPPCRAARRIARAGSGWAAQCDETGWFLRRQCAPWGCWCVTRRGAAAPCAAEELSKGLIDNEVTKGETDDANDVDKEKFPDAESSNSTDGADAWTDDEDGAGSGDAPALLY